MVDLKAEVVIVGGGIMGLWLLNDLINKGCHAILLESQQLGGAQTCHSHVYIHQGYIYNETQTSLAASLKSVNDIWSKWLQDHSSVVRTEGSYFGFRSEPEYLQKTTHWGNPLLSLKYSDVPEDSWPLALRGGAVRRLVSTPERSLDGCLLVRELYEPVRDFVFRVGHLDAIRAKDSEVELVSGDYAMPRIRARSLVFAAGANNQPLIHRLIDQAFPRLSLQAPRVQQVRRAHMLVVKGPKQHLPLLTGVFGSFNGLFIVGRELRDFNIWLVSDNRSPHLNAIEDWIRFDARWWLPGVFANLADLSPSVLGQADDLQWGVYEAPKAEGFAAGELPVEERILALHKRVWAVWPTKLTLAPLASGILANEMGCSREAALPSPTALLPSPDVAPERWVETPMTDWKQFRRAYRLRGI